MKPRRKPATPAVPAPPPEPRRPPPAWTAAYPGRYGGLDGWRPTTLRIGSIRHPIYLPPFQRQPAWSKERQVAFADMALRGTPLAQILLVEVGWLASSRVYVLDGQQRLTALGLDIRRHDGTPNPPTGARFDVVAGTWGDGDGTYTVHEAAGVSFDLWNAAHAHSDERGFGLIALHEIASNIEIPCYVRRYARPTPEAGAEMAAAFDAINIPGVPIDPADLSALLAGCAGWVPDIEGATP